MVWTGLELYYTPGSPNCRAVLMCIKALGIEGVDLIKLDMYQKYEHKKPWFVKMNPQHTVPTVNDNGFVLWESRAIMCYLVNKYGAEDEKKRRLYPVEAEARANVDKLLFFDIGSLYKNIVDYFHPMLMSGEQSDDKKANALKTALDYLDGFLASKRYVASEDDMTIADLSILASVTQLEAMDYKLSSYKHLYAWLNRLKVELAYYDECNSAGIEMFRSWAKSKKSQRSHPT